MKARLKRTKIFRAIYRRGKWARGQSLSVGVLPSEEGCARVGLRTRRGLKGAVERNRLKRQLRAIIHANSLPLRSGIDLVIVIHPKSLPARTDHLERELRTLCKRIGAIS